MIKEYNWFLKSTHLPEKLHNFPDRYLMIHQSPTKAKNFLWHWPFPRGRVKVRALILPNKYLAKKVNKQLIKIRSKKANLYVPGCPVK